jgi:insertion element IS1 protein InsB
MAIRQTGSSATAVRRVADSTGNALRRRAISPSDAMKFCAPTRSGAVCAASVVRLVFPAPRSPCGSKKKAVTEPGLPTTLLPAEPDDVLESDELWSFVFRKLSQAWLWLAVCRRTRQVVAYALGDRSMDTCRRLWDAIPAAYRTAHYFHDFWEAYAAVLPPAQHTGVGKERGQTALVERCNNTLHQRLGRLVRKSLSFSKSIVMHDIGMRLFLARYNRERANIRH